MTLRGRNALITGSSSGIGRGIALRFARDGVNVVINYRSNPGGAEEVVAQVKELGVNSVAIQGDVSSVPSARQLVAKSVEALGSLDILVNNAGVESHAAFWDVSEAEYDRVLSTNLKGLFFTSQAMVNHLRATGRGGRIINISSVHEDLPFPNFSPYCASKGGVRMLTRTLAVELGPLGITVNGIAPGAIETPINTKLLHDPVKLRSLIGQIPLGRLGQPDDVAGIAAYLASDEASYVTGATYFVDGGLTWFYQEQ
jgi:glucose 1-dehydrogenase